MNIRIRCLLSSLCIFIFFSCEKYEEVVPYETYTIHQGDHSSVSKFDQLDQSVLTYDVIFDESAVYTLQSKGDQLDVNKLFGFSECNSMHHDNSARFGWRWNNDSLQVFAYCYKNKVCIMKHLCNVELKKSYRYSISLSGNEYRFSVQGLCSNVLMERGDACDSGVYYLLWPYFGGTSTAPQDIHIYMKRIR